MGFERQFEVEQVDGKATENSIEIVRHGVGTCKSVRGKLRERSSTWDGNTSVWACFRTSKVYEGWKSYEESK